MKTMGYLLLCGGFLAGAFSTSLDVENVNWMLFVVAAGAAVAGLLTIKRQASAHARSGSVLEMNRRELRESIDNVVRDLEELNSGEGHEDTWLRDQIDVKLRNDLRRFAEARESMVHLFGLQVYADIMSSFAAGERYINRVWSSSADGYPEEAAGYLKKAAKQFTDAQRQLSEAAAATA